MSTRFNTGAKRNLGLKPVPSGYENDGVGKPNFSIPSCGIEDIDIAMFNLFDKEICPEVITSESTIRVPVIFAAGEKWAMLKNNRPIRDRTSSLILPLITIMRTELTQNVADDLTGRGISPQVGEIVVRRRLDQSDVEYQSIINRLLIPNQNNLMMSDQNSSGSQISTGRPVGSLISTQERKDGAYLNINRLNNVFETIIVPTPQFFTAKYQVTVWTQYTQHANQVVEKIMSSLIPHGQSWKLSTAKGYWFVARFEDGSLSSENSFDDMSQQERFIKHTFDVTVPAYFFVSKTPGAPIPLKRHVSCPIVSFETSDMIDESFNYEEESKYVVGSDDPTLPIDLQPNVRRDQREVGWRPQKIFAFVPDDGTPLNEKDPAFANIKDSYAVKTKKKNLKGETVYSGISMGGLEIILKK